MSRSFFQCLFRLSGRTALLMLAAFGLMAAIPALAQAGRQAGGAGTRSSPTQNTTQQPGSASGSAPPVDIAGRVLNGRTHQPVARALVQLGSRRVLTDHDGVFHLPEITSASGSFRVQKPGFFPEADAAPHQYTFPADSPIELTLYPEAILSGTVIDMAGEAVPHLSVVARTSTYNDTGHHWFPAGRTQTLSDGTFRLSLPAGVYSLQLLSMGRPLAGTDVVQSLSVPANPASVNEAIRLAPGDQVHLDLRPPVRRVFGVTLHLDHAPERGFPMLTARPVSGPPITLAATPNRDDPGTFRTALPNGTYEIVADLQSQDGRQQGRANVTVAGHDVTGVQLPLAPVPVFPVAVEVDSSATSDNATPPPTAAQLGLMLTATTADLNDQVFTPAGRGGATPSFSLPSGSYRFHARTGAVWYVMAASCGGTDLLQQNLTVASGSGGAEIRIRVSNRTADLSGTAQLAGAPAAAWVYLVATTPSPAPLLFFRSGATGSFTRPYLPPGSYRAVALEHQVSTDLQSPDVLNRLGGRVQTLTVNAGDHAALSLSVVPATELAP